MGRAIVRKTLNPSLTGPKAERLDCNLRARVIGQQEAVEQIVNVYQTYLAGMNAPGRPIGNFLFLGPTGTGKTHLVEATAESLLGSHRAVTKVDCSEFQHSHEICKLIGSPPGYLGHRETKPLLSQKELDKHHTEDVQISLVLFDEIEKADDALWHLLLGVLDKAELTLGDNSKTDFSRCMVFMTSNLGAAEMEAMMSCGLGFSGTSRPSPKTGQIARVGVEAARKRFTPEFINRLDKMVVFHRLGEKELREVLELELSRVQSRILRNTPFVFDLTPAARNYLLEEGTDEKYGARHLKRVIERSLVHPLASLIATGQVSDGDVLEVDFDPKLQKMTFEKVAEEMQVDVMFRSTGLNLPEYQRTRAASASVDHVVSKTA